MMGKCLGQACFLLLLSFTFAATAQPSPLQSWNDDKYEEGLELYRKGQYGNAQRLLDEVSRDVNHISREKRSSAEYYAALAAMELYNKDAESRVENFAERYELSPLRNRLYLEYANYRFSIKQYRDAAEYYEKVDKFRLDREDLNEYLFKRGYALLSVEREQEARKIFFELKDKDSPYANSARYYYAHLLYADSNYAEALTSFLPLQDDASFGPLVPYYLAHIYYRLGDYDKLLEVGEELVEKATPGRAPEIAKLVADAFYNKGEYENAIKYMELYREKGGRMLVSDHFELGYSYYRTGKYRLAIESFNKITGGSKPLLQNAYYHLGDCYLKVGEKRQAITAFKAASEIEALPTVREDAFFNYAKLVYELSDPYRDAISVLNDFLDEFPSSPRVDEVNRYLANLYVTTKDYEKAMLAIKRTGMGTPEMQEVYQKVAFYRATEVFNSLRYAEAIVKYRESQKYPVNKTILTLSLYWTAEAYYRLGEYDKALEGFENFRNSPGAFNMDEYLYSLYQTAYCYYKKFDFQKAAANFRSFTRDASKKDPRLPDSYLRMADSYLLTGGYLVAADFYNSALDAGTKEADYALFQRAECLGLAGKREQKIDQLDRLIRKYPNSIYAEDAHFEKAGTYLQLENYNKALAEYQSFINDYPGSARIPKAKMQIGLVYSNTDRNAEALTSFKNVVNEYPGTDESLEAVGLARLIYARENRINEYLDWVDALDFVNFEKSSLDSTAFNAAFDNYSSGNCAESIEAFRNYLNRFSQGIFALKANYYLADCASRQNDLSTARQAYENILEYPHNEYTAEALEKLARYAYDQKDYAGSRKLYRRLADNAQERPRQIKANAGIMRTAFALGDYQESAVFAELVLGAEVSDPRLALEARRILANSYFRSEDYDKALAAFQEISSNSEGEARAEAMYFTANIQYRNENYEASIETINALIRDLPSFKDYKMKALILLARNFWKQGDLFQADYTLDFVIKSDYSPEISSEAESLKNEIKRSEQEEVQKTEDKIREESKPIILDEGSGLMMIDENEEAGEEIEPIDTNLR